MSSEPGPYKTRSTQYSLCLSTDPAPSAEIDRELEIAAEAGFSCVELWAPTLEAYLARYPAVWLDMQVRQHAVRSLIVNGLEPLGNSPGDDVEDALIGQARFLELCAHLDALGGGTIILHPPARQEIQPGDWEAAFRTLRAYAGLAAPYEVILAFEFRANSAVPTWTAAQELVERAARSSLRLSLSTHEWHASEPGPHALDEAGLERLTLVHLDSPLPSPTLATFAPEPSPTHDEPALTLALCTRLAAAGFHGPYCIPYAHGPDTPLEGARAARQAAWDLLTPLYADD